MAEALQSRQALTGRVAGACLALGPLLEQWGHMQVGRKGGQALTGCLALEAVGAHAGEEEGGGITWGSGSIPRPLPCT